MQGLSIPKRGLAPWCREIINQCSVSIDRRRAHYNTFRNLYLTSNPQGSMSIYPLIRGHILQQAANLYSPSELNWHVAPYTNAGTRDRAMGRSVGAELSSMYREDDIDELMEEAVIWSLVKGKCFVQQLWTDNGLEAHLVQPEVVGVFRDDVDRIDKQDAFFISSWLTTEQFIAFIRYRGYSNSEQIIAKATAKPTGESDEPGPGPKILRNIVIGAAYGQPYQPMDSRSPSTGRNLVNWMSAPEPDFNPRVLESLVRLDELWIRDYERNDWITLQIAAKDVVLTNLEQPRNLYSDIKLSPYCRDNPLRGKQPLVEFCPNPVKGYFWGMSECAHVALVQGEIEQRIHGINRILRHQEDPSYRFAGNSGLTQNIWTRLRKPGGWFTDPNPNTKAEKIGPEVGADMWQSLHEYEAMFERLGLTDVLRGRGEEGVRAQAHAETLARTGAAQLRRPAWSVKRSVEKCGQAAFDLLRAQSERLLIFEVPQAKLGPFNDPKYILDPNIFEPSVEGYVSVLFSPSLLDSRFRVSIQGLSSSPAFAKEGQQTELLLAKAGAEAPDQLIERLGAPNADELTADLHNREVQQAKLIALHPELLGKHVAHKR